MVAGLIPEFTVSTPLPELAICFVEMVQNVGHLKHLASLDNGTRAENGTNDPGKALATSDDNQQTFVEAQSLPYHVFEHLGNKTTMLSGGLRDAQHLSVLSDPTMEEFPYCCPTAVALLVGLVVATTGSSMH